MADALKSLKYALKNEHEANQWKRNYLTLLASEEDRSTVESTEPRLVVKSLLFNLGRAQAQIRQARSWKDPIIGNTASPTTTDATRGLLWRYVIAYSGWEQCTTTLKIYQRTQESLFDEKLVLNPPPLTNRQKSALGKWVKDHKSDLEPEFVNVDSCEILDFLGITSRTYLPFPAWVMGDSTAVTQPQLLAILRNIAAHGALSPTKASKWGLAGLYSDGAQLFHPLFKRLLARLYTGHSPV